MKPLSTMFYFLFLFLIINVNISSAKEINVTKITTIEMNDDLSLNISTKYSTSANLLDFYSDAFMGLNNYSGIEFNYRGSLIESPSILIKFVRVEGFDSDFKYFHIAVPNFEKGNFPQEKIVYFNFSNLTWDNLSKTSKTINLLAIKPSMNSINKNADMEYIFDYELRIKSKNNSWFPDYFPPSLDFYSRYFTNDTLVLNYKSNIIAYEQTGTVLVVFRKKYAEVLDSYKKIKINDVDVIETVDENFNPIFIEEGKTSALTSVELGNEFDRNFQVNDVYYIINNQKLYPSKYKNLSELTKFAFETNDTFTGYSIDELANNKLMYLGLANIESKSFGLHYIITGIPNNKSIKNSNDVFTKDVGIPISFLPYSPNTLYTFEVEIPEGYFIEENSINHRGFLSNPNGNSKSVIWQYKYSDIEPLVPFKFSYSKNEKKLGDNLFYFNFGFLIVILLVYRFIPTKQKTIISVAIFFASNIVLPQFFERSEFINLFLYSMAYLPLLMIVILEAYNYRAKLKDKLESIFSR